MPSQAAAYFYRRRHARARNAGRGQAAAWALWLLLGAAASPAYAQVAFTTRHSHTATLLPNGDILVVGGINTAGTFLTGVQILREQRGFFVDAASLATALPGGFAVARASHTATLLPNGKVLVTGGMTAAAGAARADAVVYDPVTNAWVGVTGGAAGGAMAQGRFNHTATLLKGPSGGTALICGGQNTVPAVAAGGHYNDTCDLYTPEGLGACATAGGCMNPSNGAGSDLSVPRSLHTSTLLPDGRVFITGGHAIDGSVNPYLVTSQIYTPTALAAGSFRDASSLIQARAFHTATVLGDGKVMIVGGFNGKNEKANRGVLETAEIYDPFTDSVAPAAPMSARKHAHTASLDNDGTLFVFGGLGNVATVFLNLTGTLPPGSSISGCFSQDPACVSPGVVSTMTINAGTLTLKPTITLSPEVTGAVQTGAILFSTPRVSFPGGIAYFTSGREDFATDSFSGLRADMAGTAVFCETAGCGKIRRDFPLTGLGGQYFLFPRSVTPQNIPALGAANFTISGSINALAPAAIITGGSLTGPFTIKGLPDIYSGTVSSGYVVLSGAVSLTTVTVALTKLVCPVSGAPSLASDGQGGKQVSWTATCNSPEGTVDNINTDTNVFIGPPISMSGAPMTGMAGTLRFVVTTVNLSNQTLEVDLSTVIIRRMMFSDLERFDPKANAWSLEVRGWGPQRYAHTMTLLPSGSLDILGGLSCDPLASDVSCNATMTTRGTASVIPKLAAWTPGGAMPGPRANHTTTLLPDGKVLVAGGTSGPNVLASSLLLNPAGGDFTATGSMIVPRDLHSATLLPNGRVLAAGGFTTQVTTGSTGSSEIYYPDTKTWALTSTMAVARDNHAAVLLSNGNILVIGGYNGAYLASAEIYFSTSGAWAPVASMPAGHARARHAATLLQDGRVLVAGGVNASGVMGSSLIYDPAANTWGTVRCLDGSAPGGGFDSCSASLVRAHSHRATLLYGGNVLLTGGNDGFGDKDYSMIYDPVAAAWTPTGIPLNVPRFNHTATLLPNGNVLVAGGGRALGFAGLTGVRSVETFSVGASSWQLNGALNTARAFHSTVVSKNGFLFAVGGFDNGAYLSSSESIYFAGSPDLQSVGAPPSLRLSSITAADISPFDGHSLTLAGRNFQGRSEASGGGAGSANSEHYHPRVVLQGVESSGGTGAQGGGAFALDLTTRVYTNPANLWSKMDSSLTFVMPPFSSTAPAGGNLIPYGWHHLRVGSNAQFSDSILVQAGPPKPNVSPGTVAAGAATITDTAIVWTWTDVNPAFPLSQGGYNVYSATSGLFITTITFSTQAFTQRGLSPNTPSRLSVAAYTLSGDGPLSTSATFFTLSTSPINLAFASVGFDRLVLTWETNGNSLGTVYEVSQSSDGFLTSFSTPFTTLQNLTTTTALIDLLQTNTTYHFRVRAFNGAGIAANFSNVISTRTRSPVTGLSGTALDSTRIQWNWIDPGAVSFFNVYNATTGALLASPAANVFFDVNLATNSARSIRVSAVTNAGEGPLSNSATAFTLAAVPGFFTPPVLNLTTGSFIVAWTANGNPLGTQYVVTVATGAGVIVTTTALTTGFTAGIGNLNPPAEVFTIAVRSLNGSGVQSSPLAIGSTATLANPPVSLAVTQTTPNSISVSWSANNNSSSATFEVSLTTNDFATIQRPLPFSAASIQTSLIISGLQTSATYSIRVQARNKSGTTTAFSNIVTTAPFNGGVAPGSLGGSVLSDRETILSGNIAGGRLVTLRVPPNTFPSSVFITISSFTIPPSPCGAAGANIGVSVVPTPALDPIAPFLLSVSYTDAELAAVPIPANQVTMMRVSASGRCVPLLTTVNTIDKTITGRLNHLSQFQIAGLSPSNTPETTVIFPNPFYPSRGQGHVTFSQMPAGAQLSIFTLRGELVFKDTANASGLILWSGINRSGRSVASGVYLAVVESGGFKKILKLAVLR